jgi:hypothetical protein
MSPELSKYLAECYRRDVMGQPLTIEDPRMTRELALEIQAEMERIDGMGLGANLAQRSFGDYQHRNAMIALLDRLKAKSERAEVAHAPGKVVQPGGVQAERLDADGGSGQVPPCPESEAGVGNSLRDPATWDESR